MRLTERDLDAVNARLEAASPAEILRFVADVFGDRAAILSSMQQAGTALCHMADRAGLSLDVLFVDTGVLHAETLATRDELARTHPHLRVITLHPDQTFARQTAAEGLLYLSKEGQERCCDLRKSTPLRRVKGRYDALVSALRRGEGGARARVRPVGLDPEQGALRFHPLHALGRGDLDAYLAQPGVVVNPLHAMGFPTIGCFPCTTPVLPDEPERAGRWRHLAGVAYCGINPVDGDGGDGGIDLDDRYRQALGLLTPQARRRRIDDPSRARATMRPMAPRTPLSRQGVATHLRGANPELPLFLGSPHLHGGAAVLLEEGVFRLRRLELADEGQAIYFRHQEQGTGPFQPESVDEHQRPTGAVLAEGADVESFLVELEKIAWPPRW